MSVCVVQERAKIAKIDHIFQGKNSWKDSLSSCLHTYKNEILCLRCFKKAIDTYLRFKIRITADIFFCSPVCFHIVKCSKKLFLIIKISWAHFNGKLTISTVFLILKRKSILKATYTFNIDNTNIRKSFTNLNTTNCIFTYLKQYVVWYFY